MGGELMKTENYEHLMDHYAWLWLQAKHSGDRDKARIYRAQLDRLEKAWQELKEQWNG
jgi:hypothetical protein